MDPSEMPIPTDPLILNVGVLDYQATVGVIPELHTHRTVTVSHFGGVSDRDETVNGDVVGRCLAA